MKRRFLICLFLLAADGILMFLFRNFPDLFFPVYRNISKSWIAFLSALSGGLKIAVWDIGALVLFFFALITLVLTVIKKRSFLNWLSYAVLVAAILLSIAVDGWMLNHYAPKLSSELDLVVGEYSYEQLYETTQYYYDEAAKYAAAIARDEEGHAMKQDFYEMASLAGASYEKLAESYPVFKGSSVRIKKLSLIGEYLMYNGIVGMFMPISGEAGVPGSVPIVPLAFTMTHEAGHRLGLAGEEEANFAAYLACVNSEDVRFIYSGYYNAFSYCFSALYRTDPEEAVELYKSKEDRGHLLVRLDRSDTSAVYRSYDSPLQEVSDKVNDTYLKTFSEKEGIKSYGIVTDYLIAWHLEGR
ncbi:MAG: DUF3810 domain-containing protein [Erysipelotrichaceae bacterium]|nr:DUF3810 domain-containing protein [Erysipelotrichaceae bacterium]